MRPLLYDVYSGAGGAAMGYYQAGFRVIGIDHLPQPRYPFGFIQMDAFEFFYLVFAGQYPMPDVWHCSPPCQAYSVMRNLPWLRQKSYPRLIEPTRELLIATGKPWVIENVMGARKGANMRAGWLCGTMFGRPFYRHRLFETSFFWLAPGHPEHQWTIRPGDSLAGRARDMVFTVQRPDCPSGMPSDYPRSPDASREIGDRRMGGGGRAGGRLRSWYEGAKDRGVGYSHAAGIDLVREVMGIEWMTRAEIMQAIPPVYTEFIGEQMLNILERE